MKRNAVRREKSGKVQAIEVGGNTTEDQQQITRVIGVPNFQFVNKRYYDQCTDKKCYIGAYSNYRNAICRLLI